MRIIASSNRAYHSSVACSFNFAPPLSNIVVLDVLAVSEKKYILFHVKSKKVLFVIIKKAFSYFAVVIGGIYLMKKRTNSGLIRHSTQIKDKEKRGHVHRLKYCVYIYSIY